MNNIVMLVCHVIVTYIVVSYSLVMYGVSFGIYVAYVSSIQHMDM